MTKILCPVGKYNLLPYNVFIKETEPNRYAIVPLSTVIEPSRVANIDVLVRTIINGQIVDEIHHNYAGKVQWNKTGQRFEVAFRFKGVLVHMPFIIDKPNNLR